MLKSEQEFLSAEDTTVVRNWLNDKGARLFRKLVAARVHEDQINATQKFYDERKSHRSEGEAILVSTEKYNHTLDVMEEFTDVNSKLYTLKITQDILCLPSNLPLHRNR